MQRRPAVIAQLTTPKALGGFRAGLGDAPGIVAIRPATGESLNIYGYRIDDRKSLEVAILDHVPASVLRIIK